MSTTTTPLPAPTTASSRVTQPPIADDQPGVSPRRAAIIAGVSYVLLFGLGVFANFFVREGLVDSADAQITATNIAESGTLFRLGLISFLVIFLLDVVVAWALYIIFRPVNRDLSQLAAWFRLVYTVMLGVAIIYFFRALQLLGGSDVLDVIDRSQLEAEALVSLESFNSTWLIGLAAFGLHLVLLGYVILANRVAPRALGWVLVAAGLAYVVDTTAHGLLADYASYEVLFTAIVAVPAVIAEGWFGLWLLLKGGRNEERAAVVPAVDKA